MRNEEKKVMSKGKEVGVATYEIWDSVAEATETKGEATVLDLINSQNRTNALNAVRSSATGKPSKKALYLKAIALLAREDPEAIARCGGDESMLDNLVMGKVQEIEREAADQVPVTISDDDVEDDEDEDV